MRFGHLIHFRVSRQQNFAILMEPKNTAVERSVAVRTQADAVGRIRSVLYVNGIGTDMGYIQHFPERGGTDGAGMILAI